MKNFLESMSFTLRMDREIISEEEPNERLRHYISTGSYTFETEKGEEINFDFRCYSATIDKHNKKYLHVYVCDYDEDYSTITKDGEEETTLISKGMIKSAKFTDFFIYTGEEEEPEINAEKILNLQFHFIDGTTVCATQEQMEIINCSFEEKAA